MACRLVGVKPLSEPLLEYCWLDPLEQTLTKCQSEFIYFHSRKSISKCRLQNGGHFVLASMCWGIDYSWQKHSPEWYSVHPRQEDLVKSSHIITNFSTCVWYAIYPFRNLGWVPFNTLRPRQMDAISQTTFSSAFSWMKMFEFRLKFHWSLFLRVQLTIFQHWFR